MDHLIWLFRTRRGLKRHLVLLSDYYWKQWYNYRALRNKVHYFWQMSFKCNCLCLIIPRSELVCWLLRSFIKTCRWAVGATCFDNYNSQSGHMTYNCFFFNRAITCGVELKASLFHVKKGGKVRIVRCPSGTNSPLQRDWMIWSIYWNLQLAPFPPQVSLHCTLSCGSCVLVPKGFLPSLMWCNTLLY